MINITEENKNECCGCNACENVCHNKSITMIEDFEGFKYPKVNMDTCTHCNACERVCPVLAEPKNKQDDFDIYACYHNDDNVLKNSSSGGIFTALAEYVLDKNGVVYGAIFSEKDSVSHIKVDNLEDLDKLRGSKYIQSDIGNCFADIKKDLQSGKFVLFTGTPCQVAGLHYFLGKKYNNLILCDFICFGVANPKLFRKYIGAIEDKFGKKVAKYKFRSKNKGWKAIGHNGSEIIFEDNSSEFIYPFFNNSFMLGYSKAIVLRPICHECGFKMDNSYSDFKIADFWGVDKIAPEMYNQKGTSMVFVNTDKAKSIYESLGNKITSQKVNYEDILKYQPLLNTSKPYSPERDRLIKDLQSKDYKYLERKYFNKYIWIVSKAIERTIRYFK